MQAGGLGEGQEIDRRCGGWREHLVLGCSGVVPLSF